MLSTHRIFSLGMVRRTIGRSIITSAEIEKYKTDTATLARWLDVSIVKEKGRAFDADRYLIKKKEADYFPVVKVFNLNGKNIIIPDQIEGKAKLVVFSFKHYGFTLVRSWINPYIERFNTSTKSLSSNESNVTEAEMQDVSQSSPPLAQSGAVAFEVCFVEYGFLSMAKTMFANNIKANVDPMQVDSTGLVFGGIKDFAAQLLLPNVYTGYAYLLDRDNKVRWRGSGQATEEEIAAMLECTQQLLQER